MNIFWLIWMLVLPILGITLLILIPIFWFVVVPKVARMLTWCRFRNTNIHAIADDSGYVELVATNVELPEGAVRTKRGWRFLPRPIWKPLGKKGKKTRKKEEKDSLLRAERIALRKYVLKGLGKPFWLGYAGLVQAVNPATLVALQQTQKTKNPTVHFNKINAYVDSLPKQVYLGNKKINIQKDLKKMVSELHEDVQAKPLTLIDPRVVKEVLPEMTPPSLMDAIESYSERVGMLERGKQYTGVIIGGAIIIALLILGIVAIVTLA